MCPACSSQNVRWPYGSPTFHDSPQRSADLGQLTGSFFQTDDLHLAHVGEDGKAVDVAADALELAEQFFLLVDDHDPLAEAAGGDIIAHGHMGFHRQRLDLLPVGGCHARAEFDIFFHVFLQS